MINTRQKRIYIIIICSVLVALATALVLLIALPRQDENGREIFTYGDFEYTVLDNGRLEITEYIGSKSEVDIPDVIENRSVYSIGEGAFRQGSLRAVKIPAFTKLIKDYAFAECQNLTDVEIEGNLESIGNSAFFGTAIREIALPDSLNSIGESAFAYCGLLKEIAIPESVTVISGSLFEKCVSLTRVSFSDGVTSIGEEAFSECSSLEDVNLGENLVKIGKRAFYNCSRVKELSISRSVAEIGAEALYGCEALEKITVTSQNARYTSEGGALADRVSKEVILMPSKSDVTEYAVPSFV
ncbi:MAG: leucine-rich repeat domain-containing protein, partial [Clostridia bacterium]|nr:leucine-rich repeat domain-containing protein [Clostridia bacterium]